MRCVRFRAAKYFIASWFGFPTSLHPLIHKGRRYRLIMSRGTKKKVTLGIPSRASGNPWESLAEALEIVGNPYQMLWKSL